MSQMSEGGGGNPNWDMSQIFSLFYFAASPKTVYDKFQDWRTILIPKGSKLKLMPSYLFFISIALDTFKMTWKMIPYTKYWLEVHFPPILRHFFKNIFFLQLFLDFPFLIIWNKKKYHVLKNLFHFTKLLIVFCFFLCYG